MSAQHTPGRLKVQHPHEGELGWEIAFEPGLQQVCQNVTEANARRLVAAWNACEGITTAELEEIAATGGMLGPREDVARIAKQRDELLAALKHIASHGNKMDFDAVAYARAAIAKAGGEV